MLAALLLSAGCSPASPGDPDKEIAADTEVTEVAPQDVKEATPETDGGKDVILPPDEIDGEVLPDEIDEPDEISQPDEIEEDDVPDDVPDTVVQCDVDCTANEECEGLLEGEDVCHPAICDWSEECGKNQCILDSIANCCVAKADCEGGSECTDTLCDDNVCKYPPLDPLPPECGGNLVIANFDFDNGLMPPIDDLEGMDSDEDAVGWNIVDSPCGGSPALYIGDPECLTYYNGSFDTDCNAVTSLACTPETEDEDCPGPNPECHEIFKNCVPEVAPGQIEMALWLKEVVLPENSLITLTFKLWLETEPDVPGSPIKFDILRLYVVAADGEKTEIFNTEGMNGTTDGECISVAVDLSQWAGQAPDIVWEFDTSDGTNNDFAGIYLDDIKVATYEQTCAADSQCDDSEICTTDTCLKFSNLGGDNDDGFCVSEELFDYCLPCDGQAVCIGEGPHPADTECYPPSCVEMPEIAEGVDFCQWLPDPACCVVANLDEYWSEGFEGGSDESNDWTISMILGNNVGWHLLDGAGCPDEGGDADTWGFYFGNPAENNYQCDTPYCHGTITAKDKIDLGGVADNEFVKLTFCLSLSTEWDDTPEEAYVSLGIDTLYAEVVDSNGLVTEVWSSDVVKGTTKGEHIPVSADLTPFAGQKVSLQFRFSTGDVVPANNTNGGAWVDEIVVESVCNPVCDDASDCAEETPDCQTASCVAGECIFTGIPDCCTANSNPECNDDDVCTADECDFVNQKCIHEPNDADPDCCTAYESLYVADFADWNVPDDDALGNCGNGQCSGDETCQNCPSDCNLCPVTWNNDFSGDQCFAGDCLYFGNKLEGNYDNGNESATGEIVSPAINLPAYGIPAVTFHLRLDTEHCDLCQFFTEKVDKDKLSLWVESATDPDDPQWGNSKQIMWDSMAWDTKGCTTSGGNCDPVWNTVSVGINDPDLVGKTVRFTFKFDSLDAFGNEYAGAWVDDFSVSTVCDGNYECISPFECPEATPGTEDCSIEECLEGICLPTSNPMMEDNQDCCSQDIIDGASFDFDGPCDMEGWQADPPFGTVKWQVHNYENYTPEVGVCSLYMGNASANNYDIPDSALTDITAISPDIDVTGHDTVEVSFWLWQDLTDKWTTLDDLSFHIDQKILASLPPQDYDLVLWQSPCSSAPAPDNDSQCDLPQPPAPCDELGCENVEMGAWDYHKYTIPVDSIFDAQGGWPSNSRIILFKFKFNSGDDKGNDGIGIFVDDFKVKTLCQQ